MSLITAKKISVIFDNKTILDDVDITVNRGEIVTLIGPNGAGKSTLVRVVLGLIKPIHGSIDRETGITIGYMPQKIIIEPYLPLSVSRFLELACNPKAGIAPKIQILEMLQEVGVSHVLHRPIQNISGGEFQRVLLARALLRKPDLLVLDEPVQGIDVIGQENLYRLITRIRDRFHCGILMVSHDLHIVMAGTDSVICLNHHVCCFGRPEMVSRDPEFLSLFGIKEPSEIAVYAHDHNHEH